MHQQAWYADLSYCVRSMDSLGNAMAWFPLENKIQFIMYSCLNLEVCAMLGIEGSISFVFPLDVFEPRFLCICVILPLCQNLAQRFKKILTRIGLFGYKQNPIFSKGIFKNCKHAHCPAKWYSCSMCSADVIFFDRLCVPFVISQPVVILCA